MGTFKVGDWVRVVDRGGDPEFFTYGQVCQVTEVHGSLVYCGEGAMYSRRFEPWTPKVGERVRCTVGTAILDEGRIYTVVEGGQFPAAHNGFFVATGDVHGALDYSIDYFEPVFTEFAADPLPVAAPAQPVAQPITQPSTKLTIQAGRYYRTRDGRKVGPMKKYDDDSWSSLGNDAGMLWACSGERYFEYDRGGSFDLISEWIDEPVVAVAEVSSPQDEEPKASGPKFKVGDRVTVDSWNTPEGWEISSISGGQYYLLSGGCGVPYDAEMWEPRFKLVEPTTTTIVDITNLEGLDAIIAKLKKIRKLQRKIAA